MLILTQQRLQLLAPFAEWEGTDLKSLEKLLIAKPKENAPLIIFSQMAGPWLKIPWAP